jgi:serine/threonine protein phosphatase PrpC
MKISYYAKTDVGAVRTENQDSYEINSQKTYLLYAMVWVESQQEHLQARQLLK